MRRGERNTELYHSLRGYCPVKPGLARLLTASVAVPAVARDGPDNELVNFGHGYWSVNDPLSKKR